MLSCCYDIRICAYCSVEAFLEGLHVSIDNGSQLQNTSPLPYEERREVTLVETAERIFEPETEVIGSQ